MGLGTDLCEEVVQPFYCKLKITSHHFRKESETPILLDEKEQARRMEERQRLYKEYRSSRQTMLDLRNEDRQRRNEAKVKQIEMAEEWQVKNLI